MGSTSSPKFLLYSHDTYGLGNIRRTLLLADELASQYRDAAILIVTGSPMIHAFRIPDGVDYIKLPCLDRVAAERYEPRFLHAWSTEVKRLRATLIEQAVVGFEPDLMIVDKRPGGVDGELLPALRRLRASQSRTRLVLGMRDILDAPERTRRALAASRTFETILEHYDEVWVYGEQSIFDAVDAYAFPSAVARMTHFCGYLKRSITPSTRVDFTPHVLVTTGGGGDGSTMIEAFLTGVATLPPDHAPRSTVVLGPEMPAHRRTDLLERFGHLSDSVTFIEFEPDLALLLGQADVVVSMAGYNTVCELLLYGRRAVLVPRAEPVQEQLIRARLFAQRGIFDIVEPDQLTPELLLTKVIAALIRHPYDASAGIDFDGLPRQPLDRSADIDLDRPRLPLDRSADTDLDRPRQPLDRSADTDLNRRRLPLDSSADTDLDRPRQPLDRSADTDLDGLRQPHDRFASVDLDGLPRIRERVRVLLAAELAGVN